MNSIQFNPNLQSCIDWYLFIEWL